jgi:hypothetical protein
MVWSESSEDGERLRERLRPERPLEAACAAALDAGADVFAWQATAEPSDLLALYQRRFQAGRRTHPPTLWVADLLSDLRKAARQKRRLCTRVVVTSSHQFVLILDTDGTMHACLRLELAEDGSQWGDAAATRDTEDTDWPRRRASSAWP